MKAIITMEVDIVRKPDESYGEYERTLQWWEGKPNIEQLNEEIPYHLENQCMVEYKGCRITKVEYI